MLPTRYFSQSLVLLVLFVAASSVTLVQAGHDAAVVPQQTQCQLAVAIPEQCKADAGSRQEAACSAEKLSSDDFYLDDDSMGLRNASSASQFCSAAAAQSKAYEGISIHNNPVLTLIREAAAGVGDDIIPVPRDLPHDMRRCRIRSMQPVLDSSATFLRALQWMQQWQRRREISVQAMAKLYASLRPDLAAAWAAALSPLLQQQLDGTGCRCRSVEILRPDPSKSAEPTALLLVMDSWDKLSDQLQLFPTNLLMMWFYARMHGYGLHIYIHAAGLPPWMPVYFIKPAGVLHMMEDLHYRNVLYLDWDMLLSPRSAPPLSVFLDEYPEAGFMLQGEFNFCAGTSLWRATPEAFALLQTWWNMGARGCCPTYWHDQSAMKHIIHAYIANITGDESVYVPQSQLAFKLPSLLPPPRAGFLDPDHETYSAQTTCALPTLEHKWLELRPVLKQKKSAVGLVGMNAHFRSWTPDSVNYALTSCFGLWHGCVPKGAPALLYHSGNTHWKEAKKDPFNPKSGWLVSSIIVATAEWVDQFFRGLQ